MFKVYKNTESTNPRVSKTNNGKKCPGCGSKKSRFIKKQKASGILSNLGLKTPLNKIPLLGDILFWTQSGTSTECMYKDEWNSQ